MSGIAAKTFGTCLLAAGLGWNAASALAAQPVERSPLTQETVPNPEGRQAGPHTCLPHDGVDDKLRHEFGERVLGQGISKDGTLLEIFMGPEGSFTVIKTTPDGMSCVVDFGEGWKTLNQLDSVGFEPDDFNVAPTPPF